MFRARHDVRSAICRHPRKSSSIHRRSHITHNSSASILFFSQRTQIDRTVTGSRNYDFHNGCRGFASTRLWSSEKGIGDIKVPEPPLAIVFTDIVKSTAIWEKDPAIMAQSMMIHDSLVRKLTTTHNGYEVKQNGDGFMIAFQSAVAALRFCLDVQTQLQDQDWPQELLRLGPAKPVTEDGVVEDQLDSHFLWRGLRLRISAHFGSPIYVWNEVIKRADWLGPVINVAARFVSVCEGGQIVVSTEFIQELERGSRIGNGPLFENHDMDTVDLHDLNQQQWEKDAGIEFDIAVLGHRHFKGVTEKQRLFLIVPKSLRGRLKYFPQTEYIRGSKGNLGESG